MKTEKEAVIDAAMLTAPATSPPIEDNVIYADVTGAYWKTIPDVNGKSDTVVNLQNVERGIILVNSYAKNTVRGNGGNVAGGGLEISYRKGRVGDTSVCTLNRDISNKIWAGDFYTSNTCIILVETPSDYTIVFRAHPVGAGSTFNYQARYMLLRTK